MPISNFRHLLSTAEELSALQKKTQKLLALQKFFISEAQAEWTKLTQSSRIGYIEAGTLHILADNGSVALKLKQLLPRLLTLFQKQDFEITGIRVEVQPKIAIRKSTEAHQKINLPIDYKEEFNKITGAISDPKLKLALTNMMRNRSHNAL